MILYFAIAGKAGRTERPCRTQSEACRVGAGDCPTGHIEADDVVTIGQDIGRRDLFKRSTPRSVTIKIDPPIELGSAGRIRYVDGYAGVELPHL